MAERSGLPAGQAHGRALRVWFWYRALCVWIAIVNLGLAASGLWLVRNLDGIVGLSLNPDRDRSLLLFCGSSLIVMGLTFAMLNIALLVLPRRPWAYFVHLGNAAAAVLLCLPAPLAIPVLYYWMQPDVREIFGNAR